MKKEMVGLFIAFLLVIPMVLAQSYSGETSVNIETTDEEAPVDSQNNVVEDASVANRVIFWTIIIIVLLAIYSYSTKGKKKKSSKSKKSKK